MDHNNEKIIEILSTYENLDNIEEFEYGVKFKLFDVVYAIAFFNEKSFPSILVVDDTSRHPHFSLKEVNLNEHTYKSICLFEEGILIEYLYSFEEKISLCVERLISLVSMPRHELLKEYHNEFLVYWNAQCVTKGQYGQYKYSLFLDDDLNFQWLEQQVFKNKTIRITKHDRFFNDASDMYSIQTAPVLFLPIIDLRELWPPLPNSVWGQAQIKDIIQGVKYQRISSVAYDEIKNKEYHKKEIFFIFKLNNYCFGCMVRFANSNKESLLTKIKQQIVSVIPLKIHRCDYNYLNKQIGNNISDKKVAIIGAGSLGSYVADGLIHAGYKNLLVIDGDKFQHDNTFRHRIPWFANDYCKSFCVASTLNNVHPEINVQFIDEYLDENNYKKLLLENNVDVVIFTVGSSDIQLRMNKKFVHDHIEVPVYFSWLEHDGQTSHIAVVNDFSEGCFECLYTDSEGKLCENKVNKADKSTLRHIRNGCGGTRVPYGNKTLLTASAMILRALNDNNIGNWLYTYHNDQITVNNYPRNCRCKNCGLCK